MYAILTKTENNLIQQQIALLAVLENITHTANTAIHTPHHTASARPRCVSSPLRLSSPLCLTAAWRVSLCCAVLCCSATMCGCLSLTTPFERLRKVAAARTPHTTTLLCRSTTTATTRNTGITPLALSSVRSLTCCALARLLSCVSTAVCWSTVASEVNRSVENIGARRLHTIVEKLCDEYSYDAADSAPGTAIVVNKQTVQTKVAELLKQTDLTRFLL